MTEQQLKDIAEGAWKALPLAHASPSNVIAQAVARSTFNVRGNHSEVHLSESELTALLLLAAVIQRQELR